MQAKKIIIIGRPGSGKSTFGLKLHKKTKIPLFHLDKYLFFSKWVKKSKKECTQIIEGLIKQKSWILDGNNAETLELRYKNAEICIYLDLPKIICIYRAIKRYFLKDKTIDDRAEGCPEKLDFHFLQYIWNYDEYVDEKVDMLKKQFPKTKFIKFYSDTDSNKFLKTIK